MSVRSLILGICVAFFGLSIKAQTYWKAGDWECRISDKGFLEEIVFKDKHQNDTVPFFRNDGQRVGPSFYAVLDGKEVTVPWIPDGRRSYRAIIDEVECRLTYKSWKEQPAIEVKLINNGHVPFQPEKAGLRMGIDTYMDKYPDWFGKYFPTLMRNERTHFYGYMQTPAGHVLGIVSPQPIASWSVDYNLGYQDPAPHWFMGHRIESLNLDLLNALPLPGRHPQNLWMLEQGETKTWTIAWVDIKRPDEFENIVSRLLQVPVLRIPQTTCAAGESLTFDVLSKEAIVSVYSDQGEEIPLTKKTLSGDIQSLTYTLPKVGLYTVRAVSGGKETKGILSAHASWRWTWPSSA